MNSACLWASTSWPKNMNTPGAMKPEEQLQMWNENIWGACEWSIILIQELNQCIFFLSSFEMKTDHQCVSKAQKTPDVSRSNKQSLDNHWIAEISLWLQTWGTSDNDSRHLTLVINVLFVSWRVTYYFVFTRCYASLLSFIFNSYYYILEHLVIRTTVENSPDG